MKGAETRTALEIITHKRWRIIVSLTVAMMTIYFGFIFLVAFKKPVLGTLVTPGLTIGMLLGVLVIVAAWILTWIYIRWANGYYDTALGKLRQ